MLGRIWAKTWRGVLSPFLYLLEDFFEQHLIMKGFILLGMVSFIVMLASFFDTLSIFLAKP